MTDPIANYLNQGGIPVQPSYFLGSKILLGYQFEYDNYKITYRIEQGGLIICDLARLDDETTSPTGLLRLFSLLKKMTLEKGELTEIKGMVIDNVFDDKLHEIRARLIQLLLKKGAEFSTDENGDNWLVFSLNKLRACSKSS
ncbi:hypothetical protein SK355_10750 [Candidatus Fukatsuia symbiotica]|uniref:Secretion protein n=1 Tax=Candidatus Fukatsuia symbiotica TaxID=1878942 RepID=A0A2U8I4B1_9GAMM|nr:hypothetical protein [Candidatus Fukatsuia symbiotica]AWK13986.1 hypothetical protein CCS41_05020 [Candidatus Fukatsuia symbiotica]MEA9445669.1 hypothetical protein [Candidatus Fukatsuia symbiotica]